MQRSNIGVCRIQLALPFQSIVSLSSKPPVPPRFKQCTLCSTQKLSDIWVPPARTPYKAIQILSHLVQVRTDLEIRKRPTPALRGAGFDISPIRADRELRAPQSAVCRALAQSSQS